MESRAVTIKTPAEIEKMQRAGAVVEEVLLAMGRLCRPGITTGELDREAAKLIKSRGGRASFLNYRGYPASICASVNEQVVHGIPGRYALRDGDILSVDVGVEIDGWHGDAARTYLIGNVPEEVQELVRVTKECFFEGIKHARKGCHLYDISAAIQTHAESHGYGVVRDLIGHGIGRSLHEPPDVPNFKERGMGRGRRLVPGMVLAIEPMINLGGYEVDFLKDGWTVVARDRKPSAHYENTIVITEGEPRILTLSEGVKA